MASRIPSMRKSCSASVKREREATKKKTARPTGRDSPTVDASMIMTSTNHTPFDLEVWEVTSNSMQQPRNDYHVTLDSGSNAVIAPLVWDMIAETAERDVLSQKVLGLSLQIFIRDSQDL